MIPAPQVALCAVNVTVVPASEGPGGLLVSTAVLHSVPETSAMFSSSATPPQPNGNDAKERSPARPNLAPADNVKRMMMLINGRVA